MGKIAMILRRPPYGDIIAAEAVRHALGGASQDLKVSLAMVDGGVLLARKGQDETGTGFTNLLGALKDCAGMGVEVMADELSLVEQCLGKEDLLEGVRIAPASEIAALVKEAEATFIF